MARAPDSSRCGAPDRVGAGPVRADRGVVGPGTGDDPARAPRWHDDCSGLLGEQGAAVSASELGGRP